jgi:hypothetical protein
MTAAPLLAHIWDRHPQDWYVEPTWTSRRLFELHKFSGSILDPACGMCNIVYSSIAAGYETFAADIVRRHPVYDIEIKDWLEDDGRHWENIVSNPPFRYAESFTKLCLWRARYQVALLLPSKWKHGDTRSRWLESTPLEWIMPITPRPSMPPGTVIEAGQKPGNGIADYCWYIWRHGYQGEPKTKWCRRE